MYRSASSVLREFLWEKRIFCQEADTLSWRFSLALRGKLYHYFQTKKGCYLNALDLSGTRWYAVEWLGHNHNMYIFNHLQYTGGQKHNLHACFSKHVPLLLDCNSIVPCHHKSILVSYMSVTHFLNKRTHSFYQTNWDLFWFHVAMISCWLLELHQGSLLSLFVTINIFII